MPWLKMLPLVIWLLAPAGIAEAQNALQSDGARLRELGLAKQQTDTSLQSALAHGWLRQWESIIDGKSQNSKLADSKLADSKVLLKEFTVYYSNPSYRVELRTVDATRAEPFQPPEPELPEALSPETQLPETQLPEKQAAAIGEHRGRAPSPEGLGRKSSPDTMILFDGHSVYHFERIGGPAELPRYEGNIYFEFKQQTILRNAGYPFSPPLHVWQSLLAPEKLDLDQLEQIPLARGGMLLSEIRQSYIARYYLFGDFGFNLRRVTLSQTDSNRPFRETNLAWARSAGINYVRRYATKEWKVSERDSSAARSFLTKEVEFNRFQANVKLDPSVFSLTGLDLPQQTPIADHRKNVNGKPLQLIWNGSRLDEVQ